MLGCSDSDDIVSDSPGVGGECDNDNYLQFGRDVLFVTTHLSNKLCDNKTVIQDRQYTEIEVLVNFPFSNQYIIPLDSYLALPF